MVSNLARIMKAAGTSLDRVVKIVVFAKTPEAHQVANKHWLIAFLTRPRALLARHSIMTTWTPTCCCSVKPRPSWNRPYMSAAAWSATMKRPNGTPRSLEPASPHTYLLAPVRFGPEGKKAAVFSMSLGDARLSPATDARRRNRFRTIKRPPRTRCYIVHRVPTLWTQLIGAT